MRHLFPSFAVLSLALISSAARAEIHWESSLKVAHAQAQLEGKLLLLHFYSDNCVWCDRLEAGAFQQSEVAEAIHRDYVPVKIHAGQNPTIAKTFRVNAYPTDVIVTTAGTALAHGTSPQAADKYVAMLSHFAEAARVAAAVAGNPAQPAAAQTAAAPADTTGAPSEREPMSETSAGTPAIAASHRNPAVTMPEARPPAPPKLTLDGYCAVR